MLTEIDLDRNNAYQAEQQAQKEKERQELNKYCADSIQYQVSAKQKLSWTFK
jgi:hypothetical protein